ncbi:hypothetical protein CMI47_18215 [Candidatus Pacearchaeota archaeon]|jgi:hypothetical protein|nr:hypothetical protein [Candidatus Pacearchaeota archaeon]|tara:strand:+ start:16193 stop:16597 length:405 start_codon:yes stop_codon:yes gene_type:complete
MILHIEFLIFRKEKKRKDMRYEELIKAVIGKPSKELKENSPQDYEGAIGISIMNSIKNRIPISLAALAKAMSLPIGEIKPAFNRLSANGMFLPYKWSMDSFILNSDNIKTDVYMQKKWCTIAAIASGITGNVDI